jgi:hypothetical protein
MSKICFKVIRVGEGDIGGLRYRKNKVRLDAGVSLL